MAEQSQFVPKGMRVMAERLGAFTRNRFRIENAGSNTALPGQIVTVTLPSNTLVDLHSLRMHGTFQAIGGGTAAWSQNSAPVFDNTNAFSYSIKPVPPEDMHQLISRMTVSANGTAIQQGCMEYNTVHAIKSRLDAHNSHVETTKQTVTPMSRPEPATNHDTMIITPRGPKAKDHILHLGSHNAAGTKIDETDFFDDTTFSTVNEGQTHVRHLFKQETVGEYDNHQGNKKEIDQLARKSDALYGPGLDTVDFQLWDWRGYLSESSVRYLPTDLVGAIQIQLTLADAKIMPVFGRGEKGVFLVGDHFAYYGGTNEEGTMLPEIVPFSYELRNIYWTVDVLSVDGPYGDMLRGKIASNGYISLLFKEYYVFHKSGNDKKSEQHRFSLSTGSMDRIYTVMRRDDYMSHNHPVTIDSVLNNPDHLYSPAFEFIMPALPYHNYGGQWWHSYRPTDKATTGYTNFKPYQHHKRPTWHYNVDHDMKYDYKINSVMHPQYQATMRDAVWDCSYMFDQCHSDKRHGNAIMNRQFWWEKCAILPCVLNLTDGPLQLMSGYDSRGHSSFIEVNIAGYDLNNYQKSSNTANGFQYDDTTPAKNLVVNKYPKVATTSVVETTAELRIGAGLSLVIAR